MRDYVVSKPFLIERARLQNRADPPRFSPLLRLAKVCRIFVANTADWVGFADSAGL